MSQNVIELNGKRYDAITGAYLGKSNVIPKHITEHYVHGKVIDGFVRPSAAPRPVPKTEIKKVEEKKQTPASPARATKPVSTPTQMPAHKHPAAGHVQAHHPERSKTLMRRGTQKPEFKLKPAIKPHAPAEMMAKPMSAIAHKRSAYGVDPSRQERAALANQHHAIKHFGTSATHSISTQVPVIAVRPTPLAVAARQPVAAPKHHTDIFEKAIANATSHLQPTHKPIRHRTRRRKLVNAMAIVATFLIIGGFVGYLNLPQLQLRVASVQAGFGASLPSYTPTGYALDGGVKQSGGTISLRFRSGDSHFTVTQQSSNWNSQTLLDNTLALSGAHKTVQRNGQTIYIYDNDGSSAAWVNGGIRYDLSGNAQLSNDDIVSIATSL